jgi:WD40 repeat protein
MTDDRRPPEPPVPATPEERAEEIAEEYLHHLRARRELEAAHPEVAGLLHAELRLAEAVCGAAAVPETPPPPPDPVPAHLHPGQPLGPYQLFEVLGQGGFGTVYRARDTRSGRDVALKVLRRDRAPNRDAADRFRRDALIVALLDHPNVVRLHEAGEIDGVLYLDAELVRGETLEDRLRHAPLPFRAAAELVRKVASALDHAHAREVVHRDVKPSNILLDEKGEPRLTDFGLARLTSGATLTETRQLLGTVDYMAPEQTGGAHTVDGRADVYALGVVLYRLLTGRVPFDGARPLAAVLYDIVHTEPAAPRRINPAVPRDLETICLKALAKESAERFATASAFAEELRRWRDGESPTVRPPTLWEKARRWRKRNRRLGRVIVVAAVVVLVAAVIALEGNWRAAEEVRLHAEVKEQKAVVEAQALLDQARQRLRVPTEGRRLETQKLLRRVARLRNHDFAEDRKGTFDLELRSLYAASLGVPELEVEGSAAIPSPERDFTLVWPAAMHPDGESMAIGTRERPVRCVRGELPVIPENEAPVRRRPHLAYSPDGKYLAFAPATGGLELWDPEATRVAATLEARPAEGKDASAVAAIHFTPDNSTLWACWDGGRVRSWSLPELKPGAGWQVPMTAPMVTAAAFDANGQVLAVGDDDGRVRLLERGGKGVREWTASRVEVVALAWSPDGHLLATATKDGNLQVRPRDEGEARYTLTAYTSGCANVLFSPDGRWLLAGHVADPSMKVWDVQTGEQLLSGPHVPWAFARDGKRFAGGNGSGVAFCTLAIPDTLRTLTGHRARVEKLTWSRDNRHFVTLDTRFEVRTWDAGRGVAVDNFTAPPSDMYAQNAAVAIDDDGRHVAYASGGDEKRAVGLIRIPETHLTSSRWCLPPGFETMTFADGRFVLMREEHDDAPPSWRTHSVLYELRSDGRPPEMKRVFRPSEPGDSRGYLDSRLTPDATYQVWVGPRLPPQKRRVEVREVATGEVLRHESVPAEVPSPEPVARLSPDGGLLWLYDAHGNHWVYDGKGARSASLASPMPVAISADSRLIARTSYAALRHGEWALCLHVGREGSAWIVLATGDETDGVAIDFSHDGQFLAWGGQSGAVTVADLRALRKQVEAFEEVLRRE